MNNLAGWLLHTFCPCPRLTSVLDNGIEEIEGILTGIFTQISGNLCRNNHCAKPPFKPGAPRSFVPGFLIIYQSIADCSRTLSRALTSDKDAWASLYGQDSPGPESFLTLNEAEYCDIYALAKMNITKGLLRRAYLNIEASTCLGCQWRSFSTTYRPRDAEKKDIAPIPAPEPGAPKAPSAADLPSPLADAPRAYGKAVEEFTPKPLSRPIGLPTPPRAGENTGVDTRTWKEKRDDFVNYDKHLAKRKMLYVSVHLLV